MALDLAGMFQDVIAAASEATAALKYQNTFLNSIHWDTKPIANTLYTTLRVVIPDVNEDRVEDIGAGPIRPKDPGSRTVPVDLNKNFSDSFVIKEYVQNRSPRKLREDFLGPSIEALARKINHRIADLVTPANFPNYSILNGASDDKFARSDITAAWTNLAKAGVPISDRGRVYLTTSATAYGQMLGDGSFINESIVAVNAAELAQQRAQLVNAYGAAVNYDQHLTPFSAGKEPAVYYHKYAIVGLNRVPQSDAPAGQVEETVMNLAGPDGPKFRLQVWYSPDDQGWKVHVNTYWGVAVARPEMATLLQTA